MIKSFTKILSLIFILTFSFGYGQDYEMQSLTVYDCEGTLSDSNEGGGDFDDAYDGNENLTFIICVPGTDQITITFEFLDTEVDHDFISFYDGADRTAPLLGTYSGQNSGFTIVSTGECLTIHFISDGSKQFKGWKASWTVNPPIPINPKFTFVSDVKCGDQNVRVMFDEPIPCSVLSDPNSLTFTGPAGGGVSSITPINCVDGFATEAFISFSAPLDESGTYGLDLTYIHSECINDYELQLDTVFNITDCPLELELLGDSVVCEGSCITLFADVKGGNPANYRYTWTPNLSSTSTMTICPTAPVTVTVTVTDGASQPVSDSKSITILALPEAGPDFSVCEFGNDTVLTGTPSGGGWAGPGIINSGGGVFRPRNARDGYHTVFYYGPNGCRDSLFATVHNVNAGPNLSACLNDAPFTLTGQPAGGTWNGTGVDAAGNYSPNLGGSFTVTYTEPLNGCIDDAIITVVDSIQIPPYDSMVVCINEADFIIPYTPNNGVWTGPGMVNRYNGTFRPSAAGEGTFTLYFELVSGCIDSTNITVADINAGVDTIVCPLDAPFVLPPSMPFGGVYSGSGVTDNGDSTYTFDPNIFGNTDNNVTITYTFGNCSDSKIIYLYRTNVNKVLLEYCEYEDSVRLVLNNYNPQPAGGTWQLDDYLNDTLDVAQMTVDSMYYAVYNFNGNQCFDSLAIRINPKPVAGIMGRDTSICVKASDFNLTGTPTGGTWSGTGIIDPVNGTFSPSTLGFNGVFFIQYTTAGCTDTVKVTVADPTPQISAVAERYCQDGSTYTFKGTPVGGTFSGPGIIDPTGIFNPDVAGFGQHTIVYSYGTGECIFYDSVSTFVYDRIDAQMVLEYKNPLCYGDSMPVRVIATGGDTTKQKRYAWNLPDFGNTNYIVPRPYDTLVVICTVSDLCSYDVVLVDTIFVHPEITHTALVGDPLCYGDSNFAKVFTTGVGRADQRIVWYRNQSYQGDSIYNRPDRYPFTIIDDVTGCQVYESVRISEYPPVIAKFLILPEDQCVSIVDPSIYIINASVGADRGTWIIGDTTIDYASSGNIDYTFKDTAIYTVSLTIQNEIGCADTLETTVCVKPVKQYFLPTAFSPNGDGDNEFWPAGDFVGGNKFLPKGYNLFDYEMQIFNRWGEMVYENFAGNNPPWDGKVNSSGVKAMPGVYVYIMKIYYSPTEIIQITGRVVLLH